MTEREHCKTVDGADVENERDAALARADKAEAERDEARALAAEATQAEESATAVARKNQATIIDRQGVELRTLRAQLVEASARAAVMREHLSWLAQTIHRAYHGDVEGPVEACQRDACASTRRILGY